MLKILQARLQQYVNRELADIQQFQKNIYFCFIDYTKAFDCVDHKNCTKFLKTGIPVHLTCLRRNLCRSRTVMEQLTGSKLEKDYVKAVSCHPVYFNICRVHHTRCQAG